MKAIRVILVKSEKDIPVSGFNGNLIYKMVKHSGQYKVVLNGEKIHFKHTT